MSKKILILSASLRAGSNSETLANAFAGGARAAGHTVEIVSLRGKSKSLSAEAASPARRWVGA